MRKLLFSSPIGRLVFLLRIVLLGAIGWIVNFALVIILVTDASQGRMVYPSWMVTAYCICAAIPGAIYLIAYTAIPRLRDVGISPWFALILLIPVNLVRGLFCLFLLLAPASNRRKSEEQNRDPIAR